MPHPPFHLLPLLAFTAADQGEANSELSPPGSTQSYWCQQCLLGAVNCTAATRAQCETPANPVADGRTYACSFPAMVQAWRDLWRNNTGSSTELTFGWVQLNSFGHPDGPRDQAHYSPQPVRVGVDDPVGAWQPGFPSLRWAQTQSLVHVSNSFQAVVLDTPSPSGAIHSCFKQPVGARLARGALATAYGRPEMHRSPSVSAAHRVGQRQLAVSVTGTGGSARRTGAAQVSKRVGQ